MIVYDKETGKQYDVPKVTLDMYQVLSYDRMQCLRGEWNPKEEPTYTQYCYIRSDGTISGLYQKMIGPQGPYDGIYFPTLEIAEEYLLIAKGEWIPKLGDSFCGCNKTDLSHGWIEGDVLVTQGQLIFSAESSFCFPSLKQMQSFIAKRKNTLHGKKGTLTIEGETYTVTFQ